MDDYNDFEEWGRYNYRPPPVNTQTSSQPPGPVRETPSDQAPRPQTPENEPWWWDRNNGSPPAVPLGGGMQGWNWDGSRWWQTATPGISGIGGGRTVDPLPPPPPPPPGPSGPGPGAVPSIPAATLPGDVQAQFNTTPAKTPVQSAYQTALLKYLDQSQQTPSLDDPILGPQAEVYRVQQQRNQERNRRGAVERAAASGLNSSGAVDRKIEQGIQEQRFNTAQYNANLLGRELERRRTELLAALHLASETGNAEAQRELQAKLAQVSAMMQQQGLNLQGQLGFGDLALRAMLGDMSNNQFYDALGVNTALGMEGLNQRALQIVMGGG